MSKIIIVKHPETGAMFTATGDEKTVKCQIKSEGIVVSDGGYIGISTKVAFPALDVRVAESPMFKNLKDGDEFPLKGVIQRRSSFEPQYEGQTTVKKGSDPGAEEATKNGRPYYSSYVFVANTEAQEHVWLNESGVTLSEEELALRAASTM